jgi:hypothetical protein
MVKIAVAGLVGGTLLFVLLFSLNVIMNQLITCDILKFSGIRPMNDQVVVLFFVYPFVLAFTAAYVFDTVYPALQGSVMQQGIS